MTVGEVCTREVVSVRREDSVLTVARLMRDRHVGNVVVVDGDGAQKRPVGILTDRDIVVGIVAQAPDKIAELQVDDVFTGELLTVCAEDPIETALDVMRDRGIRRLPVVGFDGRLRGIVTFDDMLNVMARELTDLAGVVGRERRREEHLRATGISALPPGQR
jgi:CBS domain-containing protein